MAKRAIFTIDLPLDSNICQAIQTNKTALVIIGDKKYSVTLTAFDTHDVHPVLQSHLSQPSQPSQPSHLSQPSQPSEPSDLTLSLVSQVCDVDQDHAMTLVPTVQQQYQASSIISYVSNIGDLNAVTDDADIDDVIKPPSKSCVIAPLKSIIQKKKYTHRSHILIDCIHAPFHYNNNSFVKIRCKNQKLNHKYSIYPKKSHINIPVLIFTNSVQLYIKIINPEIVSWSATLTTRLDYQTISILTKNKHNKETGNDKNDNPYITLSSTSFSNPFVEISRPIDRRVNISSLNLFFYDKNNVELTKGFIELHRKSEIFFKNHATCSDSEFSTIYF